MIKRLMAIGFIFVCATAAWMILAGVTASRTYVADHALRQQVERVWGVPHVQQPPAVINATWVKKKVETVEDGKQIVRITDVQKIQSVALDAGRINVDLKLDHRQKGLLWYAFFFKGLTGLAITIGAVITLFVLMQTTARIDWRAVFLKGAPA